MASKHDLEQWIVNALSKHSKEASITEIAKHIWTNHEGELRAAGDLFYTWQYDMRWAGQRLQKAGKLKKNSRSWSLI